MNNTDLDILASKIAAKISSQPRWLTMKQAAVYASLGQKRLILLAKSKAIVGFQDDSCKTRPWIFDKESIDAFRLGQAQGSVTDIDEEIALEIIGSID